MRVFDRQRGGRRWTRRHGRVDEEERDRRRSRLGVVVLTALAERDAQVRLVERPAGEALRPAVSEEGLAAREVAEWCK